MLREEHPLAHEDGLVARAAGRRAGTGRRLEGVVGAEVQDLHRIRRYHRAAALAGDIKKARAVNNRLMGLHRSLFVESNPIPVKWAVQQMGLIKGGIRLPLTPLTAACHEPVREAMRHAGIRSETKEGRYATA